MKYLTTGNVVVVLILIWAIFEFFHTRAEAAEPPATMMIFIQDTKSLKGVLRWENIGECRNIRKHVLDFLWAVGSDNKYYITCTPQDYKFE